MDMTEGIIARFRTMAISKASVLTGHVIGTVIQTVFGLAVVLAVARLIGFSPTADFAERVVTVDRIHGHAEITTGSGRVRIG